MIVGNRVRVEQSGRPVRRGRHAAEHLAGNVHRIVVGRLGVDLRDRQQCHLGRVARHGDRLGAVLCEVQIGHVAGQCDLHASSVGQRHHVHIRAAVAPHQREGAIRRDRHVTRGGVLEGVVGDRNVVEHLGPRRAQIDHTDAGLGHGERALVVLADDDPRRAIADRQSRGLHVLARQVDDGDVLQTVGGVGILDLGGVGPGDRPVATVTDGPAVGILVDGHRLRGHVARVVGAQHGGVVAPDVDDDRRIGVGVRGIGQRGQIGRAEARVDHVHLERRGVDQRHAPAVRIRRPDVLPRRNRGAERAFEFLFRWQRAATRAAARAAATGAARGAAGATNPGYVAARSVFARAAGSAVGERERQQQNAQERQPPVKHPRPPGAQRTTPSALGDWDAIHGPRGLLTVSAHLAHTARREPDTRVRARCASAPLDSTARRLRAFPCSRNRPGVPGARVGVP